MKSVFSTYHPIINFIFFCIVIGINIFMMHPVYLGITAAGAFTYALMLKGKNILKFVLVFLIPVTAIAAVINALTNPRGETVLLYTQYSQITLESVVYGVLTGVMLSSVILWFACVNQIMTSDKFTYLFGRIIPSLSLIFSMVMRFVPHFRNRIKKIYESQKCIGKDVGEGRLIQRILNGVNIISILFTWSLENSVDTADSMKSRGYGMKNRSSFSIYRFDRRDCMVLTFLVAVSAVTLTGVAMGASHIEFYPCIDMAGFDEGALCSLAAYVMLCFFPVAAEIKEVILWRYSQSKI